MLARSITRWIAAVAVAFVCAGPGLAASYKAPSQQVRDEKVVKAAMLAAAKGGIPAVARYVPRLEAVLMKAPVSFPLQENRGEFIILRSEAGENAAAENLMVLLGAAVEKRNATLIREYNTYPMAALILGSYAVEMGRPEAALAPLDRGLAIQPDSPILVSEKVMALYQLGRMTEGLALLDEWLVGDRPLSSSFRARMLRSKGYGMIELKRLDEAEAAYKGALELEPNHALAQNQLRYIAELRAGGPQRQPGMTTSDKAATIEAER